MSIEVAQMDAVGRLGVAIKRIAQLRAALQPFAESWEAVTDEDIAVAGFDEMKMQDVLFASDQPSMADLKRAHAAFTETNT
jgi:hypothetical protein